MRYIDNFSPNSSSVKQGNLDIIIVFQIMGLLDKRFIYVGRRSGVEIPFAETLGIKRSEEYLFRCTATGYHLSIVYIDPQFAIGLILPDAEDVIYQQTVQDISRLPDALELILMINKKSKQNDNASDALASLELNPESQRRQGGI